MIRLHAVHASPRGLARTALGPIDLEIGPGERHLIVGANGAGKTTLLRVMAGLLPPRSGSIDWDRAAGEGSEAVPSPGRDSSGTVSLWPRVAALFETPDPQFLSESVVEEIAFGLEATGLSSEEIRARVEESLDAFGLRPFASRDPRTLSAGEKARALLAAALAARPLCLLLDQTLAHLDPGSRRALEARLVRDAEEGGMALVRTHQEAEPAFRGERLHVLDEGRLWEVGELSAESVLAARHLPLAPALRVSAALARAGRWRGPLARDAGTLAAGLAAVAPGAGAGFAGTPGAAVPAGSARRDKRARRRGSHEPAFALQAMSWAPPGGAALFDGLDLEGARGEVLALVGKSGSGKSSLLRILAGIESARGGVVSRATPPAGRTLAAALALEYPERQLIGRTVLEDVGLKLWIDGVSRAERERLAVRALADLGLSAGRFASRIPATLSEGEKRRIALAGLIAEPPLLLLLDEPTAGLDPDGRRSLRDAVNALRARDRTIVLASHDLDFAYAVADRVILLAREEGGPARIVRDGDPADVFRDDRALADAGIPAPEIVAVMDTLRDAGFAFDAGARDADGVLDRLLAREPAPSPPATDVGAGAA